MKDSSKIRGANTGTQRIDQFDKSDSNQTTGSQSSKAANSQKSQKGNAAAPDTQQPATYNGEHAHAGSTGSSGGQISPQTHNTANAGRGQGGSGAGSSRASNKKP